MFVDRIVLGKSKVAIPTETKVQYDHVCEEIVALCDATKVDWGLIDDKFFNKARFLCFAEGATFATLVIGSAIAIFHVVKKRGTKVETNEEE